MLKSKIFRFDWVFLALAIAIAFGLALSAVLNDFYVLGDMGDIGFFSSAAWHNGFDLYGPPTHPFSFFNVHIVPILWLTNLVSYVLPLSKIDYWATLYGAIYAGFSAVVYQSWLMSESGPASRQDKAWAVLVALATTFSAIGVEAARLPHLEMGIAPLTLWFFLTLTQKRFKIASLCFVLCLAIREDAGFHLFGLLLLLWAILKINRRYELLKPIQYFGVLAFLYAGTALLVKYRFFMIFDTMSNVYAGTPPWHHVTWILLEDRLHFLAVNRTYITLPLLLSVGWAIYLRNPLLPLAYVAALPWLAWNLIAVRINPGHLDFYYAFPFWIALAWPLLALSLWKNSERAQPKRWPYLGLLLVSLVGWQEGALTVYPLSSTTIEIGPHEYESNPLVPTTIGGREAAFEAFIDYYAAHQASFAEAAMDEPMLGVVIDKNTTIPWIGEWNTLHPTKLPTMILYFDHSYEWDYWVEPTVQAYPAEFRYFYTVPGTKISVAAMQPLENVLPQPMPFVSSQPAANLVSPE